MRIRMINSPCQLPFIISMKYPTFIIFMKPTTNVYPVISSMAIYILSKTAGNLGMNLLYLHLIRNTSRSFHRPEIKRICFDTTVHIYICRINRILQFLFLLMCSQELICTLALFAVSNANFPTSGMFSPLHSLPQLYNYYPMTLQ